MGRHRTANEKKALDHLLTQISDFSWNKGTFAALLAYEHPVIQAKVFDTVLEVIDAFADLYVQGNFTQENGDACEKAYIIREALIEDAESRIAPALRRDIPVLE